MCGVGGGGALPGVGSARLHRVTCRDAAVEHTRSGKGRGELQTIAVTRRGAGAVACLRARVSSFSKAP